VSLPESKKPMGCVHKLDLYTIGIKHDQNKTSPYCALWS